jgi:hypothetical protein
VQGCHEPERRKKPEELDLDNVTSSRPLAETPVIRLDRCPGAVVRQSKAFPGTGTFLSVAPGELKSIVLEGNLLGRARKPAEESARSYGQKRELPTETKNP